MPRTRKRPPRTARGRGDILRQGLRALQLLVEAPRRPGDLALQLGCSRRTVERILRALESSDAVRLTVTRKGRGAWYRAVSGPAARAVRGAEG